MSTWVDASQSFKDDLQVYADFWNDIPHPEREIDFRLSALHLFVKGCFAAAKPANFDLKTLSIESFGGEEDCLLVVPDVCHLIRAAQMPEGGIGLVNLNKPI
jgi:hypothetical protein